MDCTFLKKITLQRSYVKRCYRNDSDLDDFGRTTLATLHLVLTKNLMLKVADGTVILPQHNKGL